MEASKIKSEKVYLLLRLEVKVTFLKVKLGKLIAQRKAMPNKFKLPYNYTHLTH